MRLATADTEALFERSAGQPLRLPLGDESTGDRRLEHLTELALRLLPSAGSPCHATRSTPKRHGYALRQAPLTRERCCFRLAGAVRTAGDGAAPSASMR